MNYPFEQIRNHYEDILFDIYEISKKCKYRWLNPYSDYIDWGKLFTPIEEAMWMNIRTFGKCPMYPQYPVRKYFVDFGNPVVKVAIECDGKQYHTDKEKDLNRDKALLEAGWMVYRINGADCNRVCNEFYELSDYNNYTEEEKYHILKEFYSTTGYGLIRAIAIFHMDYQEFIYHENEIDLAYQCLVERISINDGLLEELYDKKVGVTHEENEIFKEVYHIYKYGRNRPLP
ncbi:MAG: DUF559 domain-containing protein [Nanoarchaeota archaeon]